MNALDPTILKDGEYFVLEKLKALPEEMIYHTAEHTKTVVNAVEIIGENCKLTKNEMPEELAILELRALL